MVRKVNLHGSLGAFSPTLDCSLRLVARAKPKPQDFLELFIAAIALRAAGEPVAKKFKALVLGDPARTSGKAAFWSRELPMPEPDAARESMRLALAEARAQEAPWLEMLALSALCEQPAATPEHRASLRAVLEGIRGAEDTAPVARARTLL